jgi:hypothetical protein
MGKRQQRGGRAAEEAGLLGELARLFGEVDAAFAAYRCESTAECCHFALTGREPYVTSIELEALDRAVAARGGMPSARRRALPLADGRDELICPLLTSDRRCSVYGARPLGCRTFFCHRATTLRPVPQNELNGFVRRVQDIAVRHRPDGDRGRPLGRLLRSRAGSG